MYSDLNTKRILFITAGSNKIGFGHLSRCLSLAAYTSENHVDSAFLIFGDETARSKILESGHNTFLLDLDHLNSIHIDWDFVVDFKADVVITDLMFPDFLAVCKEPVALYHKLSSLGRVLMAIDVLGQDSIVGASLAINVDLLVIPYESPSLFVAAHQNSGRILQGAKYALLAPDYRGLSSRQVRAKGSRILVTCGGSDPYGFSGKILCALEALTRSLEVKVILGPLFGDAVRKEVKQLANMSHHDVRVIDAPESLIEAMLWCDLAISASGLTKYELAASGTPSLIFSIDAHHEEWHASFGKTGITVYLGTGISPEILVHETIRVLDDYELRCRMSTESMELVDGMGVQRFFVEIEKELVC